MKLGVLKSTDPASIDHCSHFLIRTHVMYVGFSCQSLASDCIHEIKLPTPGPGTKELREEDVRSHEVSRSDPESTF